MIERYGYADDFVVNHTWNKFVLFKNKVQFTKNRIIDSHVRAKIVREYKKLQLVSRLRVIDNSVDDGTYTIDLLNERKQIYGEFANMEKLDSLKAKRSNGRSNGMINSGVFFWYVEYKMTSNINSWCFC